MNYQRIYNQIVERAKTRSLEEYKEKHHIVPKCMGGSDNKENLVELTAREHFLCHWLLARIHPENYKLAYAFWTMCSFKGRVGDNRHNPSSRIYQEAKERLSKTPRTEEHRKNHSIASRNREWKMSDEAKEKLSKLKKGIPLSEEHKQKLRENHKHKSPPTHQIDAIKKALTGKSKTQITKENMKIASNNMKKIVCIICQKEFRENHYKRHQNICK